MTTARAILESGWGHWTKVKATELLFWKQQGWETAKKSTGWQVYDGTKKALEKR